MPLAAALLASSLVGGALVGVVRADNPPAPDFYWPYGQARVAGGNVSPSAQPIIAFVNARMCGQALTTVAAAGPNVPDSDVGKTVYVVDIAANGTGAAERPGCGRTGDSVLFYLPLLHRLALQQPAFHQGNERVDLDFDKALANPAVAPQLASDGN